MTGEGRADGLYSYLCGMNVKEELGKWLLDVAKYVATAVVITSFVGEFTSRWMLYVVSILLVSCCLGTGLWFIRKSNKEKKGV